MGWNRTFEEYDLVENRTFEEYDFGLIRTFRKYEFVLSESTVPYFRKVQIILKKYGPELKSKKELTLLIFFAYTAVLPYIFPVIIYGAQPSQ